MDKYIEDLSDIIKNGKMENTYKMAWARSIVETCYFNPSVKEIHFDKLAELIFMYYWNQTIYFKLEQSPNPKKRPGIYQLVVEAIRVYQEQYGYDPKWFEKVKSKVPIPIKKISTILSRDVCSRFLIVGQKEYDLYAYDEKDRTIIVKYPELLKQYSDLLFSIINYRWSQRLEEFNNTPRISQKVRGTSNRKLKGRPAITKFRKYLDLENPRHLCFISGKPIQEDKLSIDHVLPWSYLYSHDLWNLVYVDKGLNSSKGNRIPSEKTIKKLEKRNIELLEEANLKNFKNDSVIEELELSIENKWVRKTWINCKG